MLIGHSSITFVFFLVLLLQKLRSYLQKLVFHDCKGTDESIRFAVSGIDSTVDWLDKSGIHHLGRDGVKYVVCAGNGRVWAEGTVNALGYASPIASCKVLSRSVESILGSFIKHIFDSLWLIELNAITDGVCQ